MIERVGLENFQPHDKFDARLSEGITTIIGDSDKGKSSLQRGLRWLFLNKPLGDGFIRWGCDWTRVRAKIDGVTVGRERGKSDNLYTLGKEEYRAFGSEVPEDISKLVRLSDYNFTGQHDSPFWFGLTPPELARRLNKLVDLEVMDVVMAQLGTQVRALKAEQGVVEERYKEAKERATNTAFVSVVDAELKELEKSWVELDNLKKEWQNLGALYRWIRRESVELKAKKRLLEKGRLVEQEGSALKADSEKYHKLLSLVHLIKDLKEKADLKIPDMKDLDAAWEQFLEARKKYGELGGFVVMVKKRRDEKKQLEKELAAAEKELKEEMGGICPLCGKPL